MFFQGVEVSNESSMEATLIPDNTTARAVIEKAEWKQDFNDPSIWKLSIQWSILEGEFKDYKVFQNLKIEDSDPSKRQKAMKMLGAIASNSNGGALLNIQARPTDQDFQRCLVGGVMYIKIMQWEMNGNSGNWVAAVSNQAPNYAPQNSIPSDDVPF